MNMIGSTQRHYPYQDDVTIKAEFLGLSGFFSPTPTQTASVRVNMGLSSYRQWNVLCNPEPPALATGYEQKLLDYVYDPTKREHEITVLGVAKKYKHGGFSNIGDNPLNTLIYKDNVTHEIGYVDIPATVSVCCEFGWENISRVQNITRGSIIPANSKLVDSPATTNDVYKQGLNARVAPLSVGSTIEDAYPIAESFAKKLTKYKTQKIVIKIAQDQIPLNLFGDAENYLMIQRIGEKIRPDGVVAAFRNFNEKTLLYDLLQEKLMEVNEITDRKYVSKLPGGEIYDINVFVGSKANLNAKPYRVLKEYYNKMMEYYGDIVDIYQQNKHEEMTKEMNTLVTDAMGKRLANGDRVPGIPTKKNVRMVIGNKAPFIIVELLIRKKIPLTVGDKIASRHGHKGICCVVVPDNQMPVDEWGFRADMCICPMSVPKRTNPGLIHEIEINRTAEWIVKFMDEKFATDEDKFNEIMDLYKMLYPTVGKDIENVIRQAGQIPEYLQYCRDMGHIPLSGPPTAKNINRYLPKRMRERFGMKTGPVVLAGYDRNGNIVKKRTKASVIIGKVYLYFINKGATPASPGFGYVTKLNQPINNDRDKDISFVRLAPYRFGEDDLRMLAAAGVHEEFNRLRNLFGNSTAGVDVVIETQLAHPNPIKIKKFPISNEKLYDHNQSLQAYFNYIRAAGVEVEKSLITEKVALPRIKMTNDYMEATPLRQRKRRK